MRQTMLHSLLVLGMMVIAFAVHAQKSTISGTVKSADGKGMYGVKIVVNDTSEVSLTDEKGHYELTGIPKGTHKILFFMYGYAAYADTVVVGKGPVRINVDMATLTQDLGTVEIKSRAEEKFGMTRLRSIEGTAIYAGKKNEVIVLDNLVANTATNNSRQVFAKVAGLNIWESDGAGLQLGIGGRGLSPNRTSNFNTRQNGYDMSADALGYPESYYSPPTDAVERIEVVRGAASLQYGTQFGGVLNFKMKDAVTDKPFELISRQTVGSYGFLSSFNSVGGSTKKLSYYSFYQFKQGDGWRENSGFESQTAFAKVTFRPNTRLAIGAEYTHMQYLAQQAGGLTDAQFEQDARQSFRNRNWFSVNWNLAAITVDYQLAQHTLVNSRSFGLVANRQALGYLGPINRADPLDNRDLIDGTFQNFGNETRLIHKYRTQKRPSAFVVGVRYYQGLTSSRQGDANDSDNADFDFLNPNRLERSNYEFPSRNIAVFAENYWAVNEKFSITPGARFEYIRTASDGSFRRVNTHPLTNEILSEEIISDARNRERTLFLAGLGLSYAPTASIELYANASQNYRAINFNDIQIVNPNLIIDKNITDESGYTADIGVRGQWKKILTYDVSAFYLRYNDRIGTYLTSVPDENLIERVVQYRSNIADSRNIGVESFVETDVTQWFRTNDSSDFSLLVFGNFSLIDARYISSMETAFDDKLVEMVPPMTLKSGVTLRWKKFAVTYQVSHTARHFSDATNAEYFPSAIVGEIPAYTVMDLSMKYGYKRFQLETGINNLVNETYFTRRATGYPGPGIIPSDGRSLYLTLQVKI